MEMMVKKLQQRCRRARVETERWDELQSRLISQFGNAASIIDRVPLVLIRVCNNLPSVFDFIPLVHKCLLVLLVVILAAHLQHVYTISKCSIGKKGYGDHATSYFDDQVLSEDKNYDALKCIPGIKEALLGKQMETLEMIFFSMKDTMKEFHAIVISLDKIARDASQLLRGGLTPTAHQMRLRIGIHPSLSDCLDGLRTIHEMHQSEYDLKSKVISALTWKCSGNDTAALRQLLQDQPNIPSDQVQSIFDVIFAEDIP